MTRTQRIVAVLYCLLVAYCGVWVPWHWSVTGRMEDIKEGYALIWDGPPAGRGVPDVAAVAACVLAATGICTAAFLLARKWKALLLVVILAGTGILLYGYWTNRVAEHRSLLKDQQQSEVDVGFSLQQKIHDCAVAKLATSKCDPPQGKFQVCDRYALSDNSIAQEEDAAISAAEKECATESTGVNTG
jgi:hypothetical protein